MLAERPGLALQQVMSFTSLPGCLSRVTYSRYAAVQVEPPLGSIFLQECVHCRAMFHDLIQLRLSSSAHVFHYLKILFGLTNF